MKTKRVVLSIVVAALLLGGCCEAVKNGVTTKSPMNCFTNWACKHQAAATTLLASIELGANALAIMIPPSDPAVIILHQIVDEAKKEMANTCPSLEVATGLELQLSKILKSYQSQGFTMGKK